MCFCQLLMKVKTYLVTMLQPDSHCERIQLHYIESIGLCPEGHGVRMLKDGALDIGGQCAINPSGGLIAMGHPIGPTGIGQIGEIVMQLRGEAGARQHAGARTGLAHMVGVGAVCYVHILQK